MNNLVDFVSGPHHQSEEELLSPNEDVGPEFRSTHRKLLQQHHQHPMPQSPTSPVLSYFNGDPTDAAHFRHHGVPLLLNEPVAPGQQYLIPPPPNLGFSGSSSCASMTSDASYSTTTTTTGCLIAEAAGDIDHVAEQIVTPSSSMRTSSEMSSTASGSTTSSDSLTCRSDQVSVIRHPTSFTKGPNLTRDSGHSSGRGEHDEDDDQDDEEGGDNDDGGFKEHKRRMAKKGTIILNEMDVSSDQVSLDDVPPLDLSPNGDSDASATLGKKIKSKTPINSKLISFLL